MSKKATDSHGRWRSITVAFRLSPEENALLNDLVRLSGITKQEYLARRVLQKDVVVQGNPRVYKALKTYMERVFLELQRLERDSDTEPEFAELLRFISAVYDGMKNENDDIWRKQQ